MKSTSLYCGIIFKISNKESFDKVLTVILENGEKKSFLAKGVRKEKSRKSHSIDIGNYVKIKTIEGYTVPIVSEIELLNEFRNIKTDFKTLTFLQFFCEIINKFSHEDALEKELFLNFFDSLKNSTSNNIVLISIIFTLKILKDSGHLPDLSKSILNSSAMTSQNCMLTSEHIGYVKDSDESNVHKTKVDPTIYKIQRFIEISTFRLCLKLKVSEDDLKKILRIQVMWIEMILDKELKSKKMLLSCIN